jgi:hypothetical protein
MGLDCKNANLIYFIFSLKTSVRLVKADNRGPWLDLGKSPLYDFYES